MGKIRVALTLGDPCGIGPEITARVIATHPEFRENLVIVGPFQALEQSFEKLRLEIPGFTFLGEESGTGPQNTCRGLLQERGPRNTRRGFPQERGLQILDTKNRGNFPAGKICLPGGRASIDAIEAAHELCMSGVCSGMVTGPIGKKAINLAGSPFSGHTDMLCSLTGVKETRMAMVLGKLRVVMTTLHVSIQKALSLLSVDSIFDTIVLANSTFSTPKKPYPLIAVSGINPHAGEDGMFGDEEEKFIKPAMKKARKVNPNILGPFPADSMFKSDMRKKFDIFISHTHDQGLIAIKTLGGIKCVNVTLGLPYVRTSVGHGTAYDIAGKGVADHSGMVMAVKEAFRLILAGK